MVVGSERGRGGLLRRVARKLGTCDRKERGTDESRQLRTYIDSSMRTSNMCFKKVKTVF